MTTTLKINLVTVGVFLWLGLAASAPLHAANQKPVVSFKLPASDVTLPAGSNLSVEALASDADGSIASVMLRMNGSDVRQEGGKTYKWSASTDPELGNLSEGVYVLTVVSTDNEGLDSNPASLTVTVTGTGGAADRLQWTATADSPFEVNTQLRPWTIVDEGWDVIFENFSMAGINSVYLVAMPHSEKRPFGDVDQFPHNPVRDSFQAENARIYWNPDNSLYGVMKPVETEEGFLQGTDWMAEMIQKCKVERGMKVGAELSHRIFPTDVLDEHPEWQQEDVHGDKITDLVCPNDPEVREYILAVYEDLARNYDVDYIQTAQYVWEKHKANSTESCVCEDCQAVSATVMAGFDSSIDSLTDCIAPLAADASQDPYKSYIIEFRERCSALLFADIAEVVNQVNADTGKNVDLRLNDVLGKSPNIAKNRGFPLEDIAPHVTSWVNQDHKEDDGIDPDLPDLESHFDRRKSWLDDSRSYIGWNKPLLCSSAPRIDATPELVVTGVRIALEHESLINGMSLKHYDGASFGLLRAFKQGMIEGGLTGLAPTRGWEVEDMNLDGFSAFSQELAEDFGVETSGNGSATGTFDLPSGTYNVRLTYWDEAGGQSDVALLVEGSQVAAFQLDEDTDCWRARTISNVDINNGDVIEIRGVRDGPDRAKLEFIEFISTDGGSEPINQDPLVQIDDPSNGDAFAEPATVAVTVTASDSDGDIDRVELTSNGSLVATERGDPYEFTLTDLSAGTYVLVATAFDDDGASATDSITITVTAVANERTIALVLEEGGVPQSGQAIDVENAGGGTGSISTNGSGYAQAIGLGITADTLLDLVPSGGG